MLQVDVLTGHSVIAFLKEPTKRGSWEQLCRLCSWGTYFQSPSFVLPWYETYANVYEPILISGSLGGRFVGLWLLAFDKAAGVLGHAGLHQAEYQTWIADPSVDDAFLVASFHEIARHLGDATFRLKYLPSRTLGERLARMKSVSGRSLLRTHRRPLLRLDVTEIQNSFAKKSNKSRFNRLKRLGPLEFSRITTVSELETSLGDLIAYYDLRQGGRNGVTPFHDDPLKREFHVALFQVDPMRAHVTVTRLNGRAIAGLWGGVSGREVHLGIVAYSPTLAEHSPGKLHMMQLSKQLVSEGVECLDLTPGGDPWKERFASEHDEVSEVTIFASRFERLRYIAVQQIRGLGKRAMEHVGLTAASVRSAYAKILRAKPQAIWKKFIGWVTEAREYRVYRCDRELAARFSRDPRVSTNEVADLVRFEPGETWQTREKFFSEALARLERGEFSFSVTIDGRLAHYGWMVRNQQISEMTEVEQSLSLPSGCTVLYDFYTHPAFRGRGLYRATLCHILATALEDPESHYFVICVLANNHPSRHVIESLGFEFQGSFYWRKSLGRVSKAADAAFVESA